MYNLVDPDLHCGITFFLFVPTEELMTTDKPELTSVSGMSHLDNN